MKRGQLWPACLPSILHKGDRGILAGWADPDNLGKYYPENRPLNSKLTVNDYRTRNLILKHVGVQNTTCRDPEWMGSNTFYPEGAVA